MARPSTRNWTFAIPFASEALPDTAIVPETVPPVGLVTDTVGGALSTVTETGAEVVWLPAPSVARAVSTCVPLPLAPVAHAAVNGAVVSGPPSGDAVHQELHARDRARVVGSRLPRS